jgi:hypothetical protein
MPAQSARSSFQRPSARLAFRYITLAVCALGAFYVLSPGPNLEWARSTLRGSLDEPLLDRPIIADELDDLPPPPTPPPPGAGSLWPTRAKRVQDAFRHAYTSYLTIAFPHDELQPLSNSSVDKYVLRCFVSPAHANPHSASTVGASQPSTRWTP